jgi:hypothetical protein
MAFFLYFQAIVALISESDSPCFELVQTSFVGCVVYVAFVSTVLLLALAFGIWKRLSRLVSSSSSSSSSSSPSAVV